jgi:hypothetical protein
MSYPLENLNDETFQSLCQALLAKEFPGISCFPVGQPDGGRDAVLSTYSSEEKQFLVFQVKFVRDPAQVRDTRKWLLDVMKDETEKVKALVDRRAKGYFLLTNVRGSSHLDDGSIDKMDALLSGTLSVPATCWWRDDIDRRLDDAWSIKWILRSRLTL